MSVNVGAIHEANPTVVRC